MAAAWRIGCSPSGQPGAGRSQQERIRPGHLTLQITLSDLRWSRQQSRVGRHRGRRGGARQVEACLRASTNSSTSSIGRVLVAKVPSAQDATPSEVAQGCASARPARARQTGRLHPRGSVRYHDVRSSSCMTTYPDTIHVGSYPYEAAVRVVSLSRSVRVAPPSLASISRKAAFQSDAEVRDDIVELWLDIVGARGEGLGPRAALALRDDQHAVGAQADASSTHVPTDSG